MSRNDVWLKTELQQIWQEFFSDVPIANKVFVKFGRKSKYRLGSIREKDGKTLITINSHFMDPEIPEYVVQGVLAHELTHYAHGFCSPLEQSFRHPHQGGIVKKEMVARGLSNLLKLEKQWIKKEWRNYLKRSMFTL